MQRLLVGEVGWVTVSGAASSAVVGPSVLRAVQLPQRVHDDGPGLLDVDAAALPADPVDDAAGDVHRRLQVLRRADDPDLVGAVDLDAVDAQCAGLAGDRRRHPDADAVDLHGLRAGAAQLLDGVEQVGDPHLALRVADVHDQPRALRGDGAVEDAEGLGALLRLLQGGLGLAVVVGELSQRRALVGDLLAQPVLTGVEVVEDADEVLLAEGRVVLPRARGAHLDGEGEAEQQGEDPDERRGRRVPPAPRSAGARLRRRRGGLRRLRGPLAHVRGGRRGVLGGGAHVGGVVVAAVRDGVQVGGVVPRVDVVVLRPPAGVGARLVAHARNTCRRMAAALPKMRMPRTTTTAVDSCAPTPSWSPRKTISAATTTLETKEMTKTFASKMRSSRARKPPTTASRAATTAIGRYGGSHSGTVGSKTRPRTTPTARP